MNIIVLHCSRSTIVVFRLFRLDHRLHMKWFIQDKWQNIRLRFRVFKRSLEAQLSTIKPSTRPHKILTLFAYSISRVCVARRFFSWAAKTKTWHSFRLCKTRQSKKESYKHRHFIQRTFFGFISTLGKLLKAPRIKMRKCAQGQCVTRTADFAHAKGGTLCKQRLNSRSKLLITVISIQRGKWQ